MSELLLLKKPPISLIKLIEGVGILLDIPSSKEKSLYKAPLPSNYDKTVEFLAHDFYGQLNHLSILASGTIPNKTAAEFYNKILEPGFEYEDAVNAGGLLIRELYNVVLIIMSRLQDDKFRLPISENNVAVLVDGSRASYVAFDTASHVHKHGTFFVLSSTTIEQGKDHTFKTHLYDDILRRCNSQYKIPSHCVEIVDFTLPVEESDSQRLRVEEFLSATSTGILSIGISDFNIGEDSKSALAMWAVWEYSGDVVLAKGLSPVRPFSMVTSKRKFLVFLDNVNGADSSYIKATKFMRPGDSVVIVSVVESRDPLGDCRETRFDFGRRSGWIYGEDAPAEGPNCIGWNDDDVEKKTAEYEKMIENSYVEGKVVFQRCAPSTTVGQILNRVAFEEAVDSLILPVASNKEIVVECVRDCDKSIILTK